MITKFVKKTKREEENLKSNVNTMTKILPGRQEPIRQKTKNKKVRKNRNGKSKPSKITV